MTNANGTRRAALFARAAAPVAAPIAASAEVFAGHYELRADAVAEGVWVVRGADAAISFANGGAIANATILAATDAARGATRSRGRRRTARARRGRMNKASSPRRS